MAAGDIKLIITFPLTAEQVPVKHGSATAGAVPRPTAGA